MVQLLPWVLELRRAEIVDRVQNDERSVGESLLGVNPDTVFREVIAYGQADFDKPWRDLTPDDRVLLYAYLNMLRHLEELTAAFGQLFRTTRPKEPPIVVDIGCGPFTGGLALAGVLGSANRFDYIGVDRSAAMRRLGERLAAAAVRTGCAPSMARQWGADMDAITWTEPPSWRPVIVILSYLLASSSLVVADLVDDINQALVRLSRGSVTVLYTNSKYPEPNRHYPTLRDALRKLGFQVKADDCGQVVASRLGEEKTHELRYALFQRQTQSVLKLG